MAGEYAVQAWDDKDPNEAIEEAIDFAQALDTGDSLATISFTYLTQAGLTMQNQRIDGTLARVRLSAGTSGQTGRILCTANTSGGEILRQVVTLKIKDKV